MGAIGVRAAVVGVFLALLPGQSMAQAPCVAPPGWTSLQNVPPPDPNISFLSNCAFHVWAWQTFIWMMQPGPGGQPRFLSFPGVAETFAPEGVTPAAFAPPAAPKVLTLTPRSIKASDPFESVLQAGERGILIDRTGRALYYSVNVDKTYYDFIRGNKYYVPAVLEAAPATQNFPVGALEFKYAWRIVPTGEDTAGFFTMPAEIRLLTEENGKVVVDPSKTESVTVALVGVHVVGIVKDHPEWIWATFEHDRNAPDLPAGMPFDSPDAVSDKDWLFYAANTPAVKSNVPNASTVKLTNAAKQLLTPVVNAFRRFPFGSRPADASNAANIIALNADVRARVLAADPVWQKYFLVGGTWLLPNSLQPNQSPAAAAVASTRLSNATMETFTQTANNNCFSCHRTTPASKGGVTLDGKNLNLSHILTDAYFRAKQTLNVKSFQ